LVLGVAEFNTHLIPIYNEYVYIYIYVHHHFQTQVISVLQWVMSLLDPHRWLYPYEISL